MIQPSFVWSALWPRNNVMPKTTIITQLQLLHIFAEYAHITSQYSVIHTILGYLQVMVRLQHKEQDPSSTSNNLVLSEL